MVANGWERHVYRLTILKSGGKRTICAPPTEIETDLLPSFCLYSRHGWHSISTHHWCCCVSGSRRSAQPILSCLTFGDIYYKWSLEKVIFLTRLSPSSSVSSVVMVGVVKITYIVGPSVSPRTYSWRLKVACIACLSLSLFVSPCVSLSGLSLSPLFLSLFLYLVYRGRI